jgi:hypothetical protein
MSLGKSGMLPKSIAATTNELNLEKAILAAEYIMGYGMNTKRY